jgi:MoaD family protein
MQIRVAYYGQAQQITGKEEERLETITGASVRDIILQLTEQYGDPLAWLLLTNQKTHRKSVILAVNDEVVNPEVNRSLQDNDELAILPAVSGG